MAQPSELRKYWPANRESLKHLSISSYVPVKCKRILISEWRTVELWGIPGIILTACFSGDFDWSEFAWGLACGWLIHLWLQLLLLIEVPSGTSLIQIPYDSLSQHFIYSSLFINHIAWELMKRRKKSHFTFSPGGPVTPGFPGSPSSPCKDPDKDHKKRS